MCYCYNLICVSTVDINRYGFLRVDKDTDISTIHGPIADISKIFESCFLPNYQKHNDVFDNVYYALLFFQKLQNSGFMS